MRQIEIEPERSTSSFSESPETPPSLGHWNLMWGSAHCWEDRFHTLTMRSERATFKAFAESFPSLHYIPDNFMTIPAFRDTQILGRCCIRPSHRPRPRYSTLRASKGPVSNSVPSHVNAERLHSPREARSI